MTTKSAEYWAGVREEEARQASRKTYSLDAAEVARNLRRDEAQKNRILGLFPRIAYSMDAMDLAVASSHELATRALDSLGVKILKDSDPVQALDAYVAGRAHFAQLQAGTRRSALDGVSSDESFVDRYMSSKE
jgi:hypothetical protein